MEDHSFLYGALAVFSLLTLASGIHVFSKWLKMPFAVGLLLGGILVSAIQQQFSWEFFQYFHFSPEIVFYVFLPTLIFESAYHLNFRYLRRILREVVTLATVGLLIAVVIVGFGAHYFLGVPLGVSLLFGALISATDPVAVLAIFKEVHAPQKLETIVDGESLLNDATALVLFQFLLGVFITKEIVFSSADTFREIFYFIVTLVEGVGVGLAFGFIFSTLIAKSKTKGVQLTLSLVLAHVTFLVAEGLLGVSGILATVIAAFIMGNYGRRKLKSETKKSFSEIWQFLGFISNALIFILLGLRIGQINFMLYWQPILIMGVIVLLVSRPISTYFSFFLTNLSRPKKEKISFGYQSVVMWGGIRGALAAAAVLLIPEDYIYADLLQALTAGIILMTFLFNGLSISWLLKKLKIIDFSKTEKMQHLEAKILISDQIEVYLDSLLDRKYISTESADALRTRYQNEKEQSQKSFKALSKSLKDNEREVEKILSSYALGIEKRTYKKLFSLGEVTEDRLVALSDSILRQIDYLEHDILPEEREETHQVAPNIPEFANWECKIGKILSRKFLMKRFEKYKKSKILLRMMHYRARRIASWRVIHDFRKLEKNHMLFKKSLIISKILSRYEKWNSNSESKILELEVTFPEIIRIERLRMAEGACLKKEHEIEREFFEKGFLNQKVFEEMEDAVEKKESACCCRKGGGFFSL